VETFEVGGLGLVAGVDERLEPSGDEGRHPAAEHDLLAEEVGLGLLVEGGVEDAGARRPGGVGVGERERVRLAVASWATAIRLGTPPPSV